jgi:pyruvate/2-oxoglutarate/acetoin dehydrogenase E1 component
MPKKNLTYAKFEGIVQSIRENPDVIYCHEVPGMQIASWPGYPTIDMKKVLSPERVINTGIDEMWYTAAGIGCAMLGIRAIVDHGMNMTNALTWDLVNQWVSKVHFMHGGALTLPMVMIIPVAPQAAGLAAQHSEYEEDTWYMHAPGLKTVFPTTAYDAKGLMISAMRSPDPVIYLQDGGFRPDPDEVPDEMYEVPIGKAAVRSVGRDITIVSSGNGMPQVMEALPRLQKEGLSVEVIDLRTLHPLDTETLVKSVSKTGRLLTVDQSKYTLCPGAEVIARCAEAVPGAKFKRIAYPDAPAAAAPEMVNWARVNPEHVYGAAKVLLAKR